MDGTFRNGPFESIYHRFANLLEINAIIFNGLLKKEKKTCKNIRRSVRDKWPEASRDASQYFGAACSWGKY